MFKKLSYMQLTRFYLVLAVIALLTKDGELLFCTFLIVSSIWSATRNLNKDFKAAADRATALHKSILRGITHDQADQ